VAVGGETGLDQQDAPHVNLAPKSADVSHLFRPAQVLERA